MSKHYGAIAFTEAVRDVQREHGSDGFYDRKRVQGKAAPGTDALTEDEKDYLAERDSFYLATVSETGWPYVQFRGGPTGFLRIVDDHTIGWADFRGNLQYISTGNVAGDGRVALFFMDYPNRLRLKVFGRAQVVDARDRPELVAALTVPDYRAIVEQAVVVTVVAFDWNRPQHITPRFSEPELEDVLAPIRARLQNTGADGA